jgi:hypothetical protein
MSSLASAFLGTAAHGPAAFPVEKQRRRIMLSAGNQQHKLENPSGPHLAPPQKTKLLQVAASIATASIPAASIVWLCDHFKQGNT